VSGAAGELSKSWWPRYFQIANLLTYILSVSRGAIHAKVIKLGCESPILGLKSFCLRKLQGWDKAVGVPILTSKSTTLGWATRHVFCRELDEAMNDLNLWPEATRRM